MNLLDVVKSKIQNAYNTYKAPVGNAIATNIPFTPQFNQQLQNLGNVVKPIVAPIAQNIGRGLSAQGNAQAYFNPLIPQSQKTQYHINQPTLTDFRNMASGQLAQAGALTAPVATLIGGGLQGGIQAAQNLFSHRPIGQGVPQQVGQGINFGAMVAPIGEATGLIKNAVLPEAKTLLSKIVQGVGKEFFTGAGYGVVAGQNPLSAGLQFAPYGAAGPAMESFAGSKPNAKAFTLPKSVRTQLEEAEAIMNNPEKFVDANFNFPDPLKRDSAVKQAASDSLQLIHELGAQYLPNKVLEAANTPQKIIKALIDLSSQNKLGDTPLVAGFASDTPTTGGGKGLEALAQEAKKYKSADEFIKAAPPGTNELLYKWDKQVTGKDYPGRGWFDIARDFYNQTTGGGKGIPNGTEHFASVDNIIQAYKQSPNAVDLEAVRKEYKNYPEAIKQIDQAQAEVKIEKAQRAVVAKKEAEYANKLNTLANNTKIVNPDGSLNTQAIADFQKAEYELAKQYPNNGDNASKIIYYEKTHPKQTQVDVTPSGRVKLREKPTAGQTEQLQTGSQVLQDFHQGVSENTATKPLAESIPATAPQTTKTGTSIQASSPVSISPETNNYLKDLQKSQQNARGGENLGVGAKVSNFLSSVKQKLVDSAAPIEDILASEKRKGLKLLPSQDITNAIDRSKRAPVLAGQFAKDNGLVDVIKQVPDINALDQYLIAKQATKVGENGIVTGRNAAKDAQLIKDLGPTYEGYAQKVNDYSRKLLDYAVQTGLVSKDIAEGLKVKYPDYVPLNRIFGEGELPVNRGGGAGPASLSKQTVVQKLKGSERDIQSPLGSLLVKTEDAFKQGERNVAGKLLAGYKDLGGFKGLITEIKPGEKASPNTFSFLDNGVKKTFNTTPEIAAAAKSLDVQQLGIVGKILAAPVRIARVGITGLNIPFIGANAAKDQITAAINSDKALQTSILNPSNFLKSLWAAVGHGEEYDNWIRAGGGGTSFDISRNAPELTVNKIRSERNLGSKIAYTVTHPGELTRAIEDVIGRGEELTRIQQYTGTRDALIKEGMSPAEADIAAGRQSRKATVDFARSGDWGRAMNSVWLYLNAGIQGGRTLASNLRDRPAQTVAKIGVAALTPLAITTMWNLSDPQRKAAYDDIQDYEKDNNLIIVPNNPVKDPKTGKWNVIKVPLSQEVANLTVPVRHGLESLAGAPGTSFGEIAASLTGTFTGLNTQSGTALISQAIPQAVKVPMQAAFNKNFFTGNDVVPGYMQNLPKEMQVRDNTSGTARIIGKAINQSPLTVEQGVKDIAGGVGMQALNASDTLLNKAGVIPPEQIGGQSIPEGIAARFNQASGGKQLDNLYNGTPTSSSGSSTGTLPPGVVESNGSYYAKIGKSVKTFDTPEAADIAIKKDKLDTQKSGNFTSGNNVYYYDSSTDSVKNVPLTFNTPPPTSTGIQALDKVNASTYSSKISSRIKEVGTLLNQGIIDQGQAIDEIAKLQALQSQFKAPKKIKIKAISIPKVSLKTRRHKVPGIKLASYKSLRSKPTKKYSFKTTL